MRDVTLFVDRLGEEYLVRIDTNTWEFMVPATHGNRGKRYPLTTPAERVLLDLAV